jgi:hypothetical protein
MVVEHPGELIDMPDGGSFRVDPPAKTPICFADVMQERKRRQPGACHRVERRATCAHGQPPIDGGLCQECHDNSGDIGGMVDQTMPTSDLLAGIAL